MINIQKLTLQNMLFTILIPEVYSCILLYGFKSKKKNLVWLILVVTKVVTKSRKKENQPLQRVTPASYILTVD